MCDCVYLQLVAMAICICAFSFLNSYNALHASPHCAGPYNRLQLTVVALSCPFTTSEKRERERERERSYIIFVYLLISDRKDSHDNRVSTTRDSVNDLPPSHSVVCGALPERVNRSRTRTATTTRCVLALPTQTAPKHQSKQNTQ